MSKAIFVSKKTLDETLAQPPVQGKRVMEPWKSVTLGAGINILEDHEITNNVVELHRHEADLWICLEGEVTFQTGGTMPGIYVKKNADGSTDDREWKSEKIEGAETHILRAGDILMIPAGTPHVHNTTGTARLYIIKIPARELAPLPDLGV